MARAKAHMADSNYDEAVRDYRDAAEQMDKGGVGGTAHAKMRQEVESEMHSAKHEARMWKERRDHAKVLEMPVNIHEVGQKSRCGWLKKQYKKMAKRWHPDKVIGCRKRAARKMIEVSDAKEELAKQWGCKVRGGRNRR